MARKPGLVRRIWHWLSHPDTNKSSVYTAIERLGVILGFLLALVAVIGALFAAGRWIADQTSTTTTASVPSTTEPPADTTDATVDEPDDPADGTTSSSTEEAAGETEVDPGPLQHPIVVTLVGPEGIAQRGFLTPAGYVVTPTQTNLGPQPEVTWRVVADQLRSTATFVRTGDDPVASLYQVDEPELVSLVYGMRNATSLDPGDPVDGWLDPLSASPGEVLGAEPTVQLAPLVTGNELGLRLNEQERTHVLCARTEEANVAMNQVCEGIADVFEGQVTAEFIGLEADQAAMEATIEAILSAFPEIDGVVATRASAAVRTADAVAAVGREDIVVIATGGLTPDLVAAIDEGGVDSYVPAAYDGTVLTTTLVTGPSDLGIPLREPGDDGRVVGMAFAQSTSDDRTYSIPIEILRDLFPEAFS